MMEHHLSSAKRDRTCPPVTIGTLNKNGIRRLQISIPTILKLDYPNLEHLVVDYGSEDGSIEYLQQFPQIRIVRVEEPLNVPKGRNRLVREARSPYFFMVDNDIEIVDPNLVGHLLSVYQHEPRIGFISPLVVHGKTKYLEDVGLSHTRVQRPQALSQVLHHGPVLVSGYYGNCVFFRTALLEELGEHDVRYPYHNNDYDLGARAYLQGFQVLIDTDHYVIHHGIDTRVQLAPVKWRYQFYLSSMCRIICKTYRVKNLIVWLPTTIGWFFIKALRISWTLRSPQPLISCFTSLYFFIRDLPDTLRLRKLIQAGRKVQEDEFLKISPIRF